MTNLLPISAVIPTRNRRAPLVRMFESLCQQDVQPAEIIVVDASGDNETEEACRRADSYLHSNILYSKAIEVGSAAQRNQAILKATKEVIWFLDDDVILEANCLANLWSALRSNSSIGGVSAMITNQCYGSPGRLSRSLFRLMHGHSAESYAGKCLGPALNLLPEDKQSLPEVVPVEWLNTTCTLYRREALPCPVFDIHFTGYSLMEDLALSLRVAEKWELVNARTARIFHDSQPGDHKSDPVALAKMELVNRHYVMTQVMKRHSLNYYLKLAVLEIFGIITSLSSRRAWSSIPLILRGKLQAIRIILTTR